MQTSELRTAWKLVKLAVKGELPLEVFLQEQEVTPGLQLFLLLVHWLVLFGILLRTATHIDFYQQSEHPNYLKAILVTLIFYLLYLIVMSTVELARPKVTRCMPYTWSVIFVDIVLFSAFYVLTGKEESDFFLLYLLPIFIAIERMNFRRMLGVVVLLLAGLAVVLLSLAPTASRPAHELLLNIFLARSLYLLFAVVTGLFFRQMGRVQKSTFVSLLTTMSSGISVIDKEMRLVWLNEFERQIAPGARLGEKCYQAFHRRDSICLDCPVTTTLATSKVARSTISHVVHNEVKLYEIASGPVRDQRGKTVGVLSVVTDVSAREKEARRLSILQDISSLIRITDIDQPERLSDVLWRTLAGVVANDGLGFERAILMLEREGRLQGELGIGPLDKRDADQQWEHWKQMGMPWNYDSILKMKGDPRLGSQRLNQCLSRLIVSDTASSELRQSLQQAGMPYARVVIPEDCAAPAFRPLCSEMPDELRMNTFVTAPLFSKGILLGILIADNPATARSLDERRPHAELLQAFADLAAIAIESSRSVTELQSTVTQLTVLQGAARALPSLDPDEVLGTIASRVVEDLGYKAALVAVLDEKTRSLTVMTANVDSDLVRWWLAQSGLSAVGHTVSMDMMENLAVNATQKGEMAITHSLADLFRPLVPDLLAEAVQEAAGIRTIATIPLQAGANPVGNMVVGTERLQISDKDREALQAFAYQATLAIENAALHLQTQLALAEYEALLLTVTELSEKQLDSQALLRAIVQQAAGLLGAPSGSVFLRIPGKDEIEVAVTHNLQQLLGIRLRFGEGLAGRVTESGQGMVVNDYHNWPGRAELFDQAPYKELFRSVVQVPLKRQGQVLGVLAISDVVEERTFDDRDIELLERFASSAAAAIANAGIHSYLQRLVSTLPSAIIAVDRVGLITQFNKGSARISGFDAKEVLGQPVAKFYYDGEKEARRINHLLVEHDRQEKEIRSVRTFVRGKHDEKIPVRFSGAVLRGERDERIGSIAVITDLRELGILEQEYQDQQDFLAQLERYAQDTPIDTLPGLQERLRQQLDMVRKFCGIEYAILFASRQENEFVLQAVAWAGLPADILGKLPHFNWRKAGLLPQTAIGPEDVLGEAALISDWHPDEEWRKMILQGIRGQNAELLQGASCGVPVRLADNYRSMLVLGPFSGSPNLLIMSDFLRNVALTTCTSALSWLQTLHLRTRSRESELSVQLIVHRTRINLSHIIGKFGVIKSSPDAGAQSREAAGEGEMAVQMLARVVERALTSRFAEMEPEDFKFHSYALPALVQNCVDSFREQAKLAARELFVDPSLELLPYGEVDATILSVALGNLIDNALKYSFPGTQIKVCSIYTAREATITVEDVGEQMPEHARANLVKPGKRWAMSARARRIPGSGLGLWDASVIAAAHGGKVNFSSAPYNDKGRPCYKVRVSITIPLKHKK